MFADGLIDRVVSRLMKHDSNDSPTKTAMTGFASGWHGFTAAGSADHASPNRDAASGVKGAYDDLRNVNVDCHDDSARSSWLLAFARVPSFRLILALVLTRKRLTKAIVASRSSVQRTNRGSSMRRKTASADLSSMFLFCRLALLALPRCDLRSRVLAHSDLTTSLT